MLLFGLILAAVASAEFVGWTHQHMECSLSVVLNGSSYTIGPEVCHEAHYMKAVRKGIEVPKDSFERDVYKAISSLYTDLADSMQPHTIELSKLVILHPITFAIPSDYIVPAVPHKTKSFGKVIPGNKSTYFTLTEESSYFDDMKHSLYAPTYKKGGWDCLRHLEILASGCLPLFTDIEHCPKYALAAHPKKLYALLLKTPGLQITHDAATNRLIPTSYELATSSSEARLLYSTVAAALLQYTRNVFTTEAMAGYVIERMTAYSQGRIKSGAKPRAVLYLTHQDHDMDKGDYLTDMVLHGLKKLLGDEGVTDFPRRECLYKPLSAFLTSDYFAEKNKLYGMGYTIGLNLDSFALNSERDAATIRHKIVNRHYDMVILGSGHRDGWAAKLHFWDLICQHYHPLEVGWIDGSDKPSHRKLLEKYSACAGHMFSREGYESS